jgi:hypothetical protein
MGLPWQNLQCIKCSKYVKMESSFNCWKLNSTTLTQHPPLPPPSPPSPLPPPKKKIKCPLFVCYAKILTFEKTLLIVFFSNHLSFPQGLKALHSPHTGIIDWGLVTRHYGKQFEKQGGSVYTNFKVSQLRNTKEGAEGSKEGMQYPVTIVGDSLRVNYLFLLTCSGSLCLCRSYNFNA